jgi:hypothetical protein
MFSGIRQLAKTIDEVEFVHECSASCQLADGFSQNVYETNTVRNRLRQRPGSFPEITRLLAQAVLYQIDSSRMIGSFWARPLRYMIHRLRRIDSNPPWIVSSEVENEKRTWPSPCGPKTTPATVATCALSSRISAALRLSLLMLVTSGNA